jgi:hypothetical protein
VLAGKRIPCARCGETFVYRVPEGAGPTAVQTAPNAFPLARQAAERSVRTRWSNRQLAAAVFGVMLLMATGSLTFALLTQEQRRAHDKDLGPRPNRWPFQVDKSEEPLLAAPVAPVRLPALGYLPAETNIVAGIHVAELHQTKAGRELLTTPLKIGPLEVRLDRTEQWTGLQFDDLDHLVLGLRGMEPTLVVRTRRAYDVEKVRAALHAERLGTVGQKKLESFEIKGAKLRPVLWCADERTLVFGLFAPQFEHVPNTPREGISHLPGEVRSILDERVRSGGPVWLAGHVADWDKVEWTGLLDLKKDDLKRLSSVRTFAAWLLLEDKVQVSAECQCRDADAARALETWFADEFKGWTSAREGEWLSLQWKTDLDGLRQALRR